MKEYIDREEFLKRLNVLYNVLDNLEKMLYSSQLIELVDIPKADVVEREKIEKAIEEMEDLDKTELSFNDLGGNVGSSWFVCLDEVLEILKRNIGG